MRSPIFKLSIIIFLLIAITSCQIKKEVIKSNQEGNKKVETVKIEFEILTDEINLGEIKKINDFRKKLKAYSDFEILARLKQTNKTTENIELDNFIIYENFEITNIEKESKDDLIRFYDYTPILDPETYEPFEINGIREIKPNEYTIDTINLVNDFRFYLSNSDTLLIRVKKQYFEKEIFSNWDTLILK